MSSISAIAGNKSSIIHGRRTYPANIFESPITTYGGRGAAKPGIDQTVHTIAYTGDVAPARLPGETNMGKDPIRIIPVNQAEKLDPLSRINMGKIYPIDHRIKVKNIGQVDPKSLPKLLGYQKLIRDRR